MLVLRSRADLAAAPVNKRINGFSERAPIKLDFPAIPLAQLIRWQHKFDALQRRCGCASAGVVFMAGILTWLVMMFNKLGERGFSAWFGDAALGLGLVIIVTVIAKVLTLYITQMEFRWLCWRVYRFLDSTH